MAAKHLKQRIMFWTEQHDVLFLREVLSENHIIIRKGLRIAFTAWAAVEKTLTGCKDPVYFVNSKSLKDHFNHILSKRSKQNWEWGEDVWN